MHADAATQAFLDSLSDTHFRLLVEAVEDYAIFMLDPNGHVATWNSGAQKIKGYEAREIIGRHFSTFYTADDIATRKPESELIEAASKGRVVDEGWRLRKDGSHFWANVTITAIRTPDGALHGFAKVTRDMTEPRRLIELQHASALSSHVHATREQERARIARELHDDLGQQLVALKMDVAFLGQSISTGDSAAADGTLKLQTHIDTIIASVRRIAGGLRPPMLDDLGLAAALEWLAQEFRSRSAFSVTLQNHASHQVFPADGATAIYRLVQEALTNISRHANASNVRIELDGDARETVLTIQDDGRGADLDPTRPTAGFGLLGMQERVRFFDGRIEFHSAPGEGFRIDVHLPIGAIGQI